MIHLKQRARYEERKENVMQFTLIWQIDCAGVNMPISNRWRNIRTLRKSTKQKAAMASVVGAHAAEKSHRFWKTKPFPYPTPIHTT